MIARAGTSLRSLGLALALAGAALAAGALVGTAVAAEGVSAQCLVPDDLIADIADFPNSARHVVANRRLTIAAIGAASTAGTGASSPAAAWPSRLGELLSQRLSATDVSIVNLGVRGLTARRAVNRIAREVAAAKPDLVIWETGTVEAVRSEDLDEFPQALVDGMDQVVAMNADLILMTPQYARETERMINFQPYIDAMQLAAGLPGVNLFPRHAIMRYWAEQDRLVPATRVEMTRGNDQIYDCIAQLLADVIDRGLRRGAHVAK